MSSASPVRAGTPIDAGSSASSGADQESVENLPIVEFRQYTLREGQRDVLIDLFEREFVESQEALGMKIIGTFTDLDRPDRFVWIRGFTDMSSRLSGLSTFYDGPTWKAHREAANATMIDSDNVLLLEAPSAAAQFRLPRARPARGESEPAGLVTATVCHLKTGTPEAARMFEEQVAPFLEARGIDLLAWFVTEQEPNNYPRLPVREGEQVLAWFASFRSDDDLKSHKSAFETAEAMLGSILEERPEILRLKPTSRSLIRGIPRKCAKSDGSHDFDFLHGRWNVAHRRLKERGVNSNAWLEYEGTADTRPLLDGLCNIEEHRIGSEDFSGIALRSFDKALGKWAIYWVSQSNGKLQQPVHGSFDGDLGIFEGRDKDGDRSVRVRFVWQKLTSDRARWEQAFSYDDGASWETNWTMDFVRQPQ